MGRKLIGLLCAVMAVWSLMIPSLAVTLGGASWIEVSGEPLGEAVLDVGGTQRTVYRLAVGTRIGYSAEFGWADELTVSAYDGTRFGDPIAAVKPDGSYIIETVGIIYKLEASASSLAGMTQTLYVMGAQEEQPEVPEPLFPDVEPEAWYAEYVEAAGELGLFAGNPDGTFGPEQRITYAQFLTALSRLSGDDITAPAGSPWYQGYVDWANRTGLLPAEIQAGFDPDAAITRQDMAAVLGAFLLTYRPDYPVVHAQAAQFADQSSIAGYAAEGVAVCYRAGVMSGSGGGRFYPLNTATRAEAAVTLTQAARILSML